MSTIHFQAGFTAVDSMVMAKDHLVWLETPSRELQIRRLPDVSDANISYNYSSYKYQLQLFYTRNNWLFSFWATNKAHQLCT